MNTMICNVCGVEKPEDLFKWTSRQKSNGRRYKLHTCKECNSAKTSAYAKKYRQEHPEVVKQRAHQSWLYRRTNAEKVAKMRAQARLNSPKYYLKGIFDAAKKRAKQKNLEFTITEQDIVIPEKCPILGIDIFTNRGKGKICNNSPSLDRVDNSKGYTSDNVRIISYLANRMKNNATLPELLMFIKNLPIYLESVISSNNQQSSNPLQQESTLSPSELPLSLSVQESS